MALLSSVLNHIQYVTGITVANPVKGRKLKEPENRTRWISRVEAETLLKCADYVNRCSHLKPLIQLALHTGMRKGEMLGLEWGRVDLKRNIIFLEDKHTKAGRRRSIPLNTNARTALIDRARFVAEYCPDSNWVFCNKKGFQIKDVKNGFATACEKAGISDFKFHDLRHTCAAWLVTAGVPLSEVRDLLGHASVTMTEKYAHLAPENVRAAVEVLESDDAVKNDESRSSHGQEKENNNVVRIAA